MLGVCYFDYLGGGATELAIATAIEKTADGIDDVSKWAYAAVGMY